MRFLPPPPPSRPLRVAALCGLALAATAGAAAQPAAPPLRLEMNRLEGRDGGACRVWFVAQNPSAEAIDMLRIDLVLFGRDAIVLRRLAVDLGPLPAARTAVRIFDVAGQPCEGIGHLLLNDVLTCGGTEAAQRGACIDRLALASRVAGVEFHK